MKNKLSLILVCIFLISILTACGHTHTATGEWYADLDGHWQKCECGATINKEMHNVKDDECTICGSEIVFYEDGGAQLTLYNEHGDPTYCATYAEDESLMFEGSYEYTYDENGDMHSEAYYDNGVPSYEFEYAHSESGETYLADAVYYHEDGTKSFCKYDVNGNYLYYANLDAEGNVLDATEYEYNEERSWMSAKEYSNEVLAAEYEYAIDEEGNQQPLKEITYNEDGSWIGIEYDLYDNPVIEIHSDAEGNVELDRRYEHTYDEDGNKLLTKTYDNGVLTEEVEFLFGSDEDGDWSMSGKTTVYHEDGSKTVKDGDIEATWHTEITYDAEGNVTEELRYEYDYDEDGDSIGSRGYKNGKLFAEMEAIIGEDGETTAILETEYNEDGSKTVLEYDTEFNLLSETTYDAEGNVVEE